MAILMSLRPHQHPRTGVFWFRAKVPAALRAAAGRSEVTWTLGTKDREAALRVWPDALRRWEDLKAGWQRAASAETLTTARAEEIAALWAAWIAGGAPLRMDGATSDDFDIIEFRELATPDAVARMWGRVAIHMDEALRLAGVAIVGASRPLLLQTMLAPVRAAYLQADLGQIGVTLRTGPMEQVRAALPPVQPDALPPPASPPAMTFEDMWRAWQAVADVAPRTRHETLGILGQLARFLEHDDAARVTKADMLRWRDATKGGGLSNNTWNNRVSLVGQVFQRAVADGRLPTDPTEGLRLGKSRGAVRLPYDEADAAAILTAARKETQPSLRWAHWVMALSGMRVGEVLQLTAGDVAQDGRSGIWYMEVKHDPERGKAAKNSIPRRVPIHPDLAAEGFLAFAQGVREAQGDVPLFSDKKPDRYGRLGGRAWNTVGTWVREVVGITDPTKAPNHSWRHRMEDELRAAEVPEDVRDAILGHARKTTGRLYGVQGEALGRLARHLAHVHLPASVVVGSAAPATPR